MSPESYRIERDPVVGGAAVTVPPGWELQWISRGPGNRDEWLVYDARTHEVITLPKDGPLSHFNLVLVDYGWKPVAVTDCEIFYLGARSPATEKAIEAVYGQTIGSESAIELIRNASLRRARHCDRQRP